MMPVPEAEVDVSSVRLNHSLTLSADGLAKRVKCIGGVAVLMASLLKEAKKQKQKKAPQSEAAGSGEVAGLGEAAGSGKTAEASEAVDMEA